MPNDSKGRMRRGLLVAKNLALVAISVVFVSYFSQRAPAQSQTPSISSVVNLASGESSLAPGVLAAIFGNNLGLLQPSTVPVSVSINGLEAAVLTSSPQVTAQLPVEISTGTGTLTLRAPGAPPASFPIVLSAYAPGIFTSAGSIGSIWHSDGRAVTMDNPAKPGEALSLLATGLGPTNPVVATGTPSPLSPPAITATTPSLTIGPQTALVQQANLDPFSIGRYRVYFTVPATLSGGTQPLAVHIGNKESNKVILPLAGQGLPTISAIVNAASFAAQLPISPGSIVSLFGLNLGQQNSVAVFPGTSFQGLSVKMMSVPAPLFAVLPSSGQLNLLAPTELPEFGTVTVQVSTNAGVSSAFTLQMAPAAPGIFSITDPSHTVVKNAAAVFANTAWLVIPDSLAQALKVPACSKATSPASVCGRSAVSGDIVQIYTTGLGKATPGGNPSGAPLPTGSVAPPDGNPLYVTIERPFVSIGGLSAEVLFAGLSPGFAGLYQVNVRVPSGVPPGDQVQVRISATNGLADTATIAVR